MTQNKSNDKKTNNEKKENFQSTEKESKKKLNIPNQAGTPKNKKSAPGWNDVAPDTEFNDPRKNDK